MAHEPLKVGDSVTLPTYIALKGRAAFVLLIEGKYARVRKWGSRLGREFWVSVADLERERDRLAAYRLAQQQRNREWNRNRRRKG